VARTTKPCAPGRYVGDAAAPMLGSAAMDSVRHLVIGAGISGLATAAFLRDPDYLVLEADREIGGYCKTIKRDGFTWDYSGHFFHFKHPDIEAWLRERMAGQTIRTVQKQTFIEYKGELVDFPFQKNIHQLPQAEFVECLYDLYFARSSDVPRAKAAPERNFKEMLYARFGRGIAEKFLIPYNEKLYACDLGTLDKDAMGRFFPHADLTDIVRNMREADNASYNASFTYPEGGAIEYVNALASAVRPEAIALEEGLVAVDLKRRVATTTKREIRYERLVTSVPFDRLLKMAGLAHEASAFTWNKVLVFNLGFDRKAAHDRHWVYFPDRGVSFYRIVLEDLRRQRVIDDHQLVAHHHVVMDPAYVHITRASIAEHARLSRILHANGVYSIGRYGGWTYCSIEDNIVEARALASDFDAA
jgi:protoporphyrinogen oxidase